MIRLFYSVIYSLLMISLSGITNLAHALSCSDIVDQVSGTTYSSGLAQFLYYNGKTYAVSKSAITGLTAFPDAYFAMSPDISREYLYGGTDISSLRIQQASGKYGAARPVSIANADTQTFVLKHYGARLSDATGTGGTLLNAWKDYGQPTGQTVYTDIAGAPLSYTNWPVPPSAVEAPSAVAMGKDGLWIPVGTGQKLSQIVEFDGKLDCAVDMTPPASTGSTGGTGGSGIVGGDAIGAMQNVLCSSDLNSSGSLDPGEVAHCIGTGQGNLCPFSAINCTSSSGTACTSGNNYDIAMNKANGNGYYLQSTTTWCGPWSPGMCSPTQGIAGYISSQPFSGSVPLYQPNWPVLSNTFAQTINMTYSTTGTFYYIPVVGYISASAFPGSIPVYSESKFFSYFHNTTYNSAVINGGQQSGVSPIGYMAPTSGFHGGSCVCPYGTQYSCMSNPAAGGQYQCSPNQCADVGAAGVQQIMNQSYLQDDGAKDAAGNCLGTIYIFGGKPSRCRPPGLEVGLISKCCESGGQVMDDDTGGNIQMAITGLKYLYQIGQVSYATILASTGSEGMVAAGEYAASQGGVVSNAIAAGMEATASGAETATALMDSMGALTEGLVTSPAFLIGVGVFIAMKFLIGSCDAGDIQTVMARDSGMCHEIGNYCEKSVDIIGCIQPAHGFCCFNSKLARIIAEQGRPQLKIFGTDGGWGAPSNPECRGFTPEEFQDLDFNRIDLREYYNVVEKDMAGKISGAQQGIATKINQRMQQINN